MQSSVQTTGAGTCNSACTFVFLAGKDRAATPGAKIGFHAPTFPGADPALAEGGRTYATEVYRQAGVPEEFIRRALSTSNSELWFPTREELIRARVLTRLAFTRETTVGFSHIQSRAELILAMREILLFRSIEARFPEILERAATRGWAAKQAGKTDGEIIAAMRSVIGEISTRLLSEGDDQTREEFVRLFLEQARTARSLSPEACERFLDSQLDVTGVFSKALIEREQAFLIDHLSRQTAPSMPRNKGIIDAALQEALSRLPPRYVEVAAEPNRFQGQSALRCDATIAVYETVMSMRAERRYAALEGMLRQ